MISLCSKTYICFSYYNKVSTKGLSTNLNELESDIFNDVIETEKSGMVRIGFRAFGGSVYT